LQARTLMKGKGGRTPPRRPHHPSRGRRPKLHRNWTWSAASRNRQTKRTTASDLRRTFCDSASIFHVDPK
jgi:hypothetical protein